MMRKLFFIGTGHFLAGTFRGGSGGLAGVASTKGAYTEERPAHFVGRSCPAFKRRRLLDGNQRHGVQPDGLSARASVPTQLHPALVRQGSH